MSLEEKCEHNLEIEFVDAFDACIKYTSLLAEGPKLNTAKQP